MFLLSLAIGVAFAKDPCAGVKMEEDGFTHQRISSVDAAFDWQAHMKVVFSNGKTEVTMVFIDMGLHQDVLAPGLKVMLLMKDGSVVELTSNEEAHPELGGTGGVYTTWRPLFHSQDHVRRSL